MVIRRQNNSRYEPILFNRELERIYKAKYLRLALPDAANAEGIEAGISADDGNVVSESLGGYHAIKRIAVIAGEATGAKSGGDVDGEEGVSGIVHGIQESSFKSCRAW